jgi:hypothetical protein
MQLQVLLSEHLLTRMTGFKDVPPRCWRRQIRWGLMKKTFEIT